MPKFNQKKNKPVILETNLSSLEEELQDIDIPKDKFDNLRKEKQGRLIFFEKC